MIRKKCGGSHRHFRKLQYRFSRGSSPALLHYRQIREIGLASCWRYKKVWKTLENQARMESPVNALSLLKDVSQPNTIWSVVYDTTSLDFLVALGKKFDQIHEFNLIKAVSDQ
jgi:hypothetical protein